MSVMFLMMSPGKLTKTDLRGRLHPSCKHIPKATSSTKVQEDLMMRCLVEKQKQLLKYGKRFSFEVVLLGGFCMWVLCLFCVLHCPCFYTTSSLSHLTSLLPLTSHTPPTSSWQNAPAEQTGEFPKYPHLALIHKKRFSPEIGLYFQNIQVSLYVVW